MANEKKENKWGIKYTLLKAEANRDAGTAARKTAYQVGLGVVGGTAGAILCGKYSLLIGATLAFVGNVWEEATVLNPVGIGMMTAAINQPAGDTNIKQRWENVKSNLFSTTFLDKITSKKNGNKSAGKSIENKEEKTDEKEEEKTETPIGAVQTENPEQSINEVEEDLVHSAMKHFNDSPKNVLTSERPKTTFNQNNAEVDFSGM